ncbi:MAG TPA: hypothetical protein VMR50_17635 [Myxococcota bacterium]|nr:hypothetical protein [Myxococcota bacterium]
MRWVALAGGLFLAACAGFLTWLGAFRHVEIQERPIGPYTFAYRELPDATPADMGRVAASLVTELSDAGATRLRPLGVYSPDGSAQIGVAVGGGAEKLAPLGDVKLRELAAERGMVAEFPWRMALSFVVSYVRVNPAFERYRESKGYEIAPAWVLLDGDVIVNMMPIERRTP